MRSRAGSSEDVDVRAGMAQPRGPAGDDERAPGGGAGSLVAVFFDGIQPNIISRIVATHLSTSEIGKMVAGAGYTIRVHRANDPNRLDNFGHVVHYPRKAAVHLLGDDQSRECIRRMVGSSGWRVRARVEAQNHSLDGRRKQGGTTHTVVCFGVANLREDIDAVHDEVVRVTGGDWPEATVAVSEREGFTTGAVTFTLSSAAECEQFKQWIANRSPLKVPVADGVLAGYATVLKSGVYRAVKSRKVYEQFARVTPLPSRQERVSQRAERQAAGRSRAPWAGDRHPEQKAPQAPAPPGNPPVPTAGPVPAPGAPAPNEGTPAQAAARQEIDSLKRDLATAQRELALERQARRVERQMLAKQQEEWTKREAAIMEQLQVQVEQIRKECSAMIEEARAERATEWERKGQTGQVGPPEGWTVAGHGRTRPAAAAPAPQLNLTSPNRYGALQLVPADYDSDPASQSPPQPASKRGRQQAQGTSPVVTQPAASESASSAAATTQQ